jgi:hypothetical protein
MVACLVLIGHLCLVDRHLVCPLTYRVPQVSASVYMPLFSHTPWKFCVMLTLSGCTGGLVRSNMAVLDVCLCSTTHNFDDMHFIFRLTLLCQTLTTLDAPFGV